MNLINTLINYSKQLVKNVFLLLIMSLVFLGVSSSLFFFFYNCYLVSIIFYFFHLSIFNTFSSE